MLSRLKPFAPSPKNVMPASWILRIVTGAAPEVAITASTGVTMPMSLNRIDRIGPTWAGRSE